MSYKEITESMEKRVRAEYEKYKEARVKIHTQCIKDMESLLKELHLDDKVIRKEDGRVGVLTIERDYNGNPAIRFHSLTKKGTPGLRTEYLNIRPGIELEDVVEPYEPDCVKDASDIEEEEEYEM
jgi:hypothetical protein